jgi:probable rRNA maturation factor
VKIKTLILEFFPWQNVVYFKKSSGLSFLNNNRLNNLDVFFFNFQKHQITFLRKAVFETLKAENVKKCKINFVMVCDEEIKMLNKKYRKIRRITDVLSFLVVPEFFIGDIYISENRSKKQAKKYGNIWQHELAYLLIHGILHICGYTDYDALNRVKMFSKQDRIFQRLLSQF